MVIIAENGQSGDLTFVQLVLTSSFLEVLPIAVLTLGIVALFVPWLRARLIERKYHLQELPIDYPSPVVAEINAFIKHHVPNAKIKVRLADLQRLALVYPANYNQDVIAFFGGLVRVWRLNRAEGEGIILHELAHHRHRDAIVVGVGSPLVYIVRLWISVALLFAFSVLCIDLIQIFNDKGLTAQSDIWATIWALSIHFVTVFLPQFIFILVEVMVWTFAIFIVPLFGIWSAELSADRFAIENETPPGAFVGWLSCQRDAKGLFDWFTRRISHPPMVLRLWVARHNKQWYSLIFLLLLFPVGYLIKFIILFSWGLIAYIGSGFALETLNEQIPIWTDSYFLSLANTYLQLGVLLILWPWLGMCWRRLRNYTGSAYKPYYYVVYAVFGTALCLPALIDSSLTGSCDANNIKLTTDKAIYKVSDSINIKYSGLPGNDQDWITVVKSGAPADDWGIWDYTKGKVNGKYSIVINEPGKYESRIFIDWPTCGFKIMAQQTFTILN